MSYDLLPGTPGVYDASVLQPFVDSLPSPEEQNHSMITVLNLQNLSGYVNDYAAAVGLHNHVQDLRRSLLSANAPDTLILNNSLHLIKNWDDMAGREAAMTLFHFGKALMQIKANMRLTPTIKEESDSDILRKASGELERGFPNYNVARHAVGHRAEAVGSFDGVKEHAIEIEGGKEFLIGQVRGDDYIATFEKKLLTVPLTEEARQRLSDIAALIYSAFPKLVHLLPSLSFSASSPEPSETPLENHDA
ncbi:hypothetical protein [Agrobacterium rosae]|uniref:Uncharacterized protein n=1 Tax=Agrobacterium rosae TaxID=1972867 RepID=A0AAE5RTN2_9HYPH|nr:hypothetical protein [Agrobacterium rosae]KAA3511598.1 hypothetical protein DXM21_14225 [Agrobacterium rosae]KAA3518978.1 hypothetical protein DXM25_13790 [Agrobacterium rosae]MQB49294.1 hypothetical protein [Agrobacterium rosae]POO49136.1 hypothetical protein CPJ18_22050 [Agrobacterium rosae]